MTKFLLLLLFTIVDAQSSADQCNLCVDIATRAKKIGSDSESLTKAKALTGANTYPQPLKDQYTNELNCHWDKYYGDANYRQGSSPLSTCADTGLCPISNQIAPYKVVDITNTTKTYGTSCVRPKIILMHHTSELTIETTIEALNKRGLSVQYIVAKNGTIYQMVSDWHRAYHAGYGHWREIHDVNSYSVGIEIVNSGDEPYQQVQMDSVNVLVQTLMDRWFVRQDYVIGHMEIRPSQKQDPSGYFPWSQLNSYLGILPGLFNSNLTASQMGTVLISNSTWDEATLSRVQEGLLKYGYGYLPMTPNQVDLNTLYNIQSFNRHFCPEVFIKEVMNPVDDSTILNGKNMQWYAISDERLAFLLSTMK